MKVQDSASGGPTPTARHHERRRWGKIEMGHSWIAIFTVFLLSATIRAGEGPVILRVASRESPTRLNPFLPLADMDRRAVDLLFEPLVAAIPSDDGGVHFRPALAEAIPFGQGTNIAFRLRPNAKWSNGEPVTGNDVRHTLRLLREWTGAPKAWRSLIDADQLGATPAEVRIPLRHGQIEPWENFTFPIVPQQFQKRELNPFADKDFSQTPLGSGPFVVAGAVSTDGVAGAKFRKNPHHPDAPSIPFDEIHWFAVKDAKSLEALRPDLTLGLPATPGHAPKAALTRRVWYVAINHRHEILKDVDLRRFLGHALKRDAIPGVSARLVANGLTPNDSWARAPAPRVPDNLHQPEVAAALAAKLAATKKPLAVTLKFPADQADKAAALVEQWKSAAQAKGLELTVALVPLSGPDLADALANHDYELALTTEDHGDSIGRLMAMFDPSGSSFLGVQDPQLLSQIGALGRTRQFPELRTQVQNLHVHLTQTMPIIPLWQHEERYLLISFRAPRLDPLRPFATIAEWRK